MKVYLRQPGLTLARALKLLKAVDPGQQSFIDEIMVRTHCLTNITQHQASELNRGLHQMLAAYHPL